MVFESTEIQDDTLACLCCCLEPLVVTLVLHLSMNILAQDFALTLLVSEVCHVEPQWSTTKRFFLSQTYRRCAKGPTNGAVEARNMSQLRLVF